MSNIIILKQHTLHFCQHNGQIFHFLFHFKTSFIHQLYLFLYFHISIYIFVFSLFILNPASVPNSFYLNVNTSMVEEESVEGKPVQDGGSLAGWRRVSMGV